MNPVYLVAWIPETLLNEKGQTEWDKFLKIEERTTVDEDEDDVLVVPSCNLFTGRSGWCSK